MLGRASPKSHLASINTGHERARWRGEGCARISDGDDVKRGLGPREWSRHRSFSFDWPRAEPLEHETLTSEKGPGPRVEEALGPHRGGSEGGEDS